MHVIDNNDNEHDDDNENGDDTDDDNDDGKCLPLTRAVWDSNPGPPASESILLPTGLSVPLCDDGRFSS